MDVPLFLQAYAQASLVFKTGKGFKNNGQKFELQYSKIKILF